GRASWSIWAISGFGAPVYTEACVGPASLVETAPGDRFRRGPSASRGARSLSGWRGSALPAWGCQQLLGDSLHRGRVDLALVGLSAVPDEPAHLLRVRDVERGQPLPDETPDRVGIEALGEEALAELDLEPEPGRRGLAAGAELLVLGQGLLELLPVGADDVEDEGVVHGAAEPLGRPPLGELGLQHPDDVG